MQELRRVIVPVFGIALGYIIMSLVLFGEQYVLQQLVVPSSGLRMEDWILQFRTAQWNWVLAPAVVSGAIWLFATLSHSGIRNDLRPFWVALWIASIGLGLFAAFFRLPPTDGSSLWPVLFGILNGALDYYISTAWSTVATHKFSPIGSLAARKAW